MVLLSFFFFRENNKLYYEKQLAQLVERRSNPEVTSSSPVLFLLSFIQRGNAK